MELIVSMALLVTCISVIVVTPAWVVFRKRWSPEQELTHSRAVLLLAAVAVILSTAMWAFYDDAWWWPAGFLVMLVSWAWRHRTLRAEALAARIKPFDPDWYDD